MPLVPITLAATLEPFRLRLPSTSQSSVQVITTIVVTFLDDSTTAVFQPGLPTTAVARRIYDGSTTNVDSTTDNWLLIAVKGTPYPVWVKARDIGTIETLTVGKGWAPLRMLAEGRLYPLFLEGIGSGLPQPLIDGALLYVDPTTHQPVWLYGTKGDIPYVDASGLWQLRHIGNPNDVLVVDPITGTPVWVPSSGIIPIGGGGSISSSLSTKVLSLWNGTGNNAPPTGWQTVGFDDIGWSTPVEAVSSWGIIAGAIPLWPTVHPLSNTEQSVFRTGFQLASSGILGASLLIVVDDLLVSAAINGNVIAANVATAQTPLNISIPPSLLNLGGANVLAMQVANQLPVAAWLGFKFSVS